MNKEEFKAEMMRRCKVVRNEFPQCTALYVYMQMIACRFDMDKARDAIRNNKPIKVQH